MNTKEKIISGLIGIVALANCYVGGKAVYNRGYESGRQQGRQEIKTKLFTEAKIHITNCEDDMSDLWREINNPHTTSEERQRLHEVYRYKTEKMDVLADLIDEVVYDNYQINGAR
jgi:hypothetical protein